MFKISSLLVTFFFLLGSVAGQADHPLAAKSEEAAAAMNSGDYEQAIALYEELIGELPDAAALKVNLGTAHYLAGHYSRSLTYLSEGVEADPSLTSAWLFLGASHLELGHPDQAIPYLERYLEQQPEQPEALQMLSDALLAAEQFEPASRRFEELTRLNPRSARAWFGLGRAYEALSGWAFRRVEELAPESAFWFSLIAASRVTQQQYSSAFFFYRKALEADPALRGIHVAIARIYRQTGHPEWAEKEEEKEAALGIPDCEKERFVCNFLSGKLEAIITDAAAAKTAEGYYWQSQAANYLAIQAFSQLSQLPPSIELHRLKAEIQSNQGRHWEAVKEWKEALKLDPGNPKLEEELALAYYLNRDYETAFDLVTRLLKDSPGSARLNFLAGDTLLYQQRVEPAIPYLEKAVQADPDFTPGHSSLGRALIMLDRHEDAIPHLKAALPSDEDGSLHFQLMRAYQRTGRTELARETMAEYQEIQRLLKEEEERLEEEVQITAP